MTVLNLLKLKSGMYMELPKSKDLPEKDNIYKARIFDKQINSSGQGYNYWAIGTQEVEIVKVEE